MKTHVYAVRRFTHTLPDSLKSADIRLSEQVLDLLIERFSAVGDTIFDPFADFGTTLISAERLGRKAFGVEQDAELCAYAKQHLRQPSSISNGDIRSFDFAVFPRFNLSISSPIYMHQHETLDPLTAFLAEIYARVGAHLKADGRLIIEAANLKSTRGVTRFAWDLADRVSQKLPFQGEIVLNWDDYGAGYDHSYGLIFRGPED
ncbi:MAG: DNA methyltransferase [Pseudomonadota bacterium]